MVVNLDLPAVQAVVAELVGVSKQAINQMISEGKLPEGGSTGGLVLSYCERLRDQAAGRLGSELGGLDLVQERAALAREQRLGIEIKNALARSEFAPVSLLSEVLATVSQAVVERFDQLPGVLEKSCPDLPSAARAQVMAALSAARNEWMRATESITLAKVETGDSQDDEVLDA